MILTELFFGSLYAVTDRKTGKPYPAGDWRENYLDKSGTISIYESEHRFPGQKRIYFIPDGSTAYYLTTSFGELQATPDEYVLQTGNSIYKFRIDQARTEAAVREVMLAHSIRESISENREQDGNKEGDKP